MAEDIKSEEERPEPTEVPDKAPTQGQLVLAELRNMNRLLGAINQNITTSMKQIMTDVEMIKVGIGHIRRQDNSAAPVTPDAPKPYVPPSPEIDI